MPKDAVFVSLSASEGGGYPGGRPDQNLAYLCGLEEPGVAAVFFRGEGGDRSLLFKRDRDRTYELWHGPMLSVSEARQQLGFDEVFDVSVFENELVALFRSCELIFFDDNGEPGLVASVRRAMDAARVIRHGVEIRQAQRLVAELRLIKDDFEIDLMDRAGQITSQGHAAAMTKVKPGMTEGMLQAEVEFAFKQAGASGLGYPSIVASGANACCLHYTLNSCEIATDDLVLIDAGARYSGYTGDVTRTFPASGKFSREQATLYDIVLDVQESCLAAVKPGSSHSVLQQMAVGLMCERLEAAGLLDTGSAECAESGDYKRFYGHSLGHWLGRDVHDVGSVAKGKKPRLFEPGHVITIEPGIYFQIYDERVPERYRGIGIRIEDDVVVTDRGSRTLTTVVKKRSDIEFLMAQKGGIP
jgi:Xaa-Pro aminopeptidase